MTCIGIKSKHRVATFGEVFTPDNIVNDMLDLVKDDSYKLDSTFLEPACGNGNFLIPILERKLQTASKLSLEDFDRNVFIALSSIYAIDIQKDNIEEAKERILDTINETYEKVTNSKPSPNMLKVLQHILDTNIIYGNGLTGLREDTSTDIIIAEWNIKGDTVTRKDFTFNQLLTPMTRDDAKTEYEPIRFKHIYNAVQKEKEKESAANDIFSEFGF